MFFFSLMGSPFGGQICAPATHHKSFFLFVVGTAGLEFFFQLLMLSALRRFIRWFARRFC